MVLLPVVGWRFRRRGWYRRWPFLPLPSRKYMEWREHTAFGSADARPTLDQLVRYLSWARNLPSR